MFTYIQGSQACGISHNISQTQVQPTVLSVDSELLNCLCQGITQEFIVEVVVAVRVKMELDNVGGDICAKGL